MSEDTAIREQDDFAASANRDRKLQQGDKSVEALEDVTEAVYAKMERVINDPSITGKTADALRAYYALSSDWDGRNEDGIAPLKKYVDDIQSISDQAALADFLCDISL